MTFTSFGGTTVLKWMLKPWVKRSVFPLTKIWADALLIGGGLLGVGDADHDDVSKFHGLGRVVHRESVFFGDFAALAPRDRDQ